MLHGYVNEHPLTNMLKDVGWNNIPICVREVIKMLCHANIGQDLHAWERKNLINNRFKRSQNLAIKMQNRLRKTKQEV